MTTRSSVNDAYELSATAFAHSAHRLVYVPLAQPLVDALSMVSTDPPGPFLDVAAGAGALGQNYPRVTALDLVAAMLASNPSAQRVQGDAAFLPFRDGSFAIAGCAFGINHLPRPELVVREMARVAGLVGVSTWLRPEPPYAPKRIVNEVLAEQVGEHRSSVGRLLDEFCDAVGSVDAITRLLTDAGLEPAVAVHEVELAWPGVDAFLEYRLGMPSTPTPSDRSALREAVAERIGALPESERIWRPTIVVGVGRPAR